MQNKENKDINKDSNDNKKPRRPKWDIFSMIVPPAKKRVAPKQNQSQNASLSLKQDQHPLPNPPLQQPTVAEKPQPQPHTSNSVEQKIEIILDSQPDVTKKEINATSYIIDNNKKVEDYKFPTPIQLKEILNSKEVKAGKNDEEKGKPQIEEADITELLNHGYTKKEIDTFINLGITPLVLRKLIDSSLQLDISRSIEVIATCIRMGKAEAEKAKIKDCDTVLIIGNTGAGKSTAVNYWHGCEMERKKEAFASVVVVAENSPLKEVAAIGHGKSKTFIPSVIHSAQNNMAFCDCPGFIDNRGQEINIANAVNIRHVIENSESVKIILLIDYKTIRESRGNGIKNLVKTLDNLFGSTNCNSLVENASSILIGITQVPMTWDEEDITLESIKGILKENKYLPDTIISNVKIVDPLERERRAKENCSRIDWQKAINILTPVQNHKTRFNTILNTEEELKLISISKEISTRINKNLNNGKYQEAASQLEQMHYLKIIRCQQIENLYQDNLREVDLYTKSRERKIRKLADSYNWSEAYKEMTEYRDFVLIFKDAVPSLEESLIQLINYVNSKQIQFHQDNVLKAINKLRVSYDEDLELQRRYAKSLHQLLNLSKPAISDDHALQHLAGYLYEMSSQEFGSLKMISADVSNQLATLQIFANKLENKQIIATVEESLVKELKHIADAAQYIHKETVKNELKNINILVLSQLEKLKEKIQWQINGKNILVLFKQLQNKMKSSELLSLLSLLIKDSSVNQEARDLHEQLQKAQTTIASLTLEQTDQFVKDFLKLNNIIHETLLKIKTQLIAEELRIRRENERKEVEATIQAMKKIIEQCNVDAIKDILSKIAGFNTEQKELLIKSKDISLLLAERLQANFDMVKLKLDWEVNGRKLFEILKDFQPVAEESMLKKIFDQIQTIPELKAAAAIIVFIVKFSSELKDKLFLDEKGYTKIILTNLIYIQGELKKKKIEEDKILEEQRRRAEAESLVALINNQLLPNSNLEELNSAIIRLIQIAPDLLKTITLKTKIEEHCNVFFEQLSVNNYDAVLGKLTLLISYQNSLGSVLSRMGINLNLEKFYTAILQHISKASSMVLEELQEALSDEAIMRSQGTSNSFPKLGAFSNAVANFQDMDAGVAKITHTIEEYCLTVIETVIKRHVNTKDAIVFAKLLMQIQSISIAIGSSCSGFTLGVRRYVGQTLQVRSSDIDFLSDVSRVLMAKVDDKNESSRYAEEVIAEYPEFKRAAIQSFLKNTEGRTSEDILKELQISNKDPLKNCFTIYKRKYENILTKIVEKFEQQGDKELLESAINKARAQGQKLQNVYYSKYPDTVATMVANIFGVWSYLDAHSGGFKRDRTTLVQPHASQAISVFLLFGMDKANEQARNRFLQIKTGEGKSVVTAAAAIAFALVGYNVYVACYNPWLARRDEKYFNNLIKQFGLEENIIYGDFEYHTNQQIHRLGDLRNLVDQLMRDDTIQASQSKDENKSLLFIDEVDVFFSEGFLGRTYNPAKALKSTNYRDLLIHIWKKRKSYLSMNQEQFCSSVSSHRLYKEFINEYPNIEPLMKIFLEKMYDGFRSVVNNRHSYVCIDKKIGYEDLVANTIRTNTVYGQNTAFAAVKEYQTNQISEENLNDNASVGVKCGEFSYVELPKSYNMIVGVTGTLFSLSEFEDKLLAHYNIKDKIAIPSVFIKRKLEGAEKVSIFDGDMDAEDQKGYFCNIKQAVDSVISKDRAVLLVFETEERLKNYQRYIIKHPYASKTIRTNTLLTITNDQVRDLMIAEAASRSRVTEMIREFGRGSDFVCRDSQLRKKGGVHILCTFFPEHDAEEVQIKGRTCRQNDPGSFEMILYLDDLKKFKIETQNEIDQAASKYKYLVQKRNAYQNDKAKQIQSKIDKAKENHNQTLKLADTLKNTNTFFSWLPSQSDKKTQALEILHKFNHS